MAFDITRGFQVGQQVAGPNPIGIAIKGVMDRLTAVQGAQLETQMKTQAEVGAQQQLLPMKEQSAINVLREKARLFPPQAKSLSGETAGRLSLASQGEGHAKQALRILFPTGEAGSFDRGLVAAMHSPFGLGMMGNQKAQSLEFNLSRAIEAQLRSETGATAPPEELKRLTKQFIANAVADPQAAFERIQSLESGLGKTRSFIDPTGQYGRLAPSPFEASSEEDLSGLSDDEILKGLME